MICMHTIEDVVLQDTLSKQVTKMAMTEVKEFNKCQYKYIPYQEYTQNYSFDKQN